MTRTGLLLGTALAAALLAAPAQAQFPFVTEVDVTLGGGLPQITDIGNTRIVTLNAPRTYFDHGQGFFLGSGDILRFNFQNPGRGGVALLRSDFGFSVLGTVEARLGPSATDALGGNLWFFSRSGILVGELGAIRAGGILLSTSLPPVLQTFEARQQLLADDALTIASLLPPFEGGAIALSGGAALEAAGGFVALIADEIAMPGGTSVSASGTALFGAARGYRVQLARTASNDFDMVEFAIPAGFASQSDASAIIDLSGTVTAGRVHLGVVTVSSLAEAVVRAPGTLVATAAAADGGGIILSADGGILDNRPGEASGETSLPIRFEAGNLQSAGDIVIARTTATAIDSAVADREIRVTGGGVPAPFAVHEIGTATAGGDILVDADRVLVGPLAAGGSVHLLGGALVDAADILAGGDVRLIADEIFVFAPTGLRSTSADAVLEVEARTGFLGLQSRLEGFADSRLAGFAGYDIRLFGDARIGRVESAAANFSTRLQAVDGALEIGSLQGFNLVATALGELRVLGLEADGFALLRSETAGVSLSGPATIRATAANSGSLALDAATDAAISGLIDAAGDVIVVARDGDAASDAAISAGDDLFMIAGRGGTVRLSNAASVTLTGLGADANGNLVTDPEFGTFLLVPEFGFDSDGNGRRLELRALDLFGQGVPVTGGGVFSRAALAGATPILLRTDSGDIDFDAAALPGTPFISAISGRDLSVAGPDFEISFTASRDARLLAREAGLDLVESDAGRDLAVAAAGPVRLAQVSANRDVLLQGTEIDIRGNPLDGIRDLTLDTIYGFEVAGLSDGLFADNLAVSGTISLRSLAGTSVLGNLSAGGDIDILTGFITLGDLTAGGDILLAVNGVEAQVLIASGAIDISSQAERIAIAAATADDNLSVFGEGPAAIAIGRATSNAGDVRMEGASVESALVSAPLGSILVLGSSGAARLGADGGVSAGLDIEVRAFGLDLNELAAGRDLLLESRGTEGDITGDGFAAVRNLTLIAGRDVDIASAEAGGDVTLEAGGSISSLVVDAGGDAQVTGGAVALGSQSEGGVFAGGSALVQAVSGDAAIVFGEAATGFRVEATGSASMQDVRVSSAALTVSAGADILSGRLEAAGDILLEAGNLVDAGAGGGILAGRDFVARGSALRLSGAEVGRNLELETRVADLRIDGDLDISGTVTLLSAAGIAGSGSLAAQEDIDARAAGDILLAGTVATGASARFEAGGTVSLAGIETGLDAEVTALSLALGAGAAIGRDLVITATGAGFSATTALTAGRDIRVAGAGDVQLAEVEAGRDVVLTTPGALATGSVTAPGALAMSGASIALAGGTVGGSAELAAGSGPLAVSGLLAVGGDAVLRGPDSPSGVMSIARLETGGNATLVGFSVQGGTVVAGGSASVTGTGGATIELDEVIADDDVDLESPVIRVGLVRSTGLGPDADGDGFNIRLTGGLGDFGTLDAPTDIRARFTADLEIAISAAAGRDVDLEAASVGNRQSGPDIGAGRDARLVATAGDVLARVRAGDDVLVEASGDARLAQVSASGSGPDSEGDGSNIRVSAGGAVASFVMTAADDIVVTAGGAANLGGDGGVIAGRDLIVTGATLELTDSDAGRDLILEATAGDIAGGPVFTAARDLALTASGRVAALEASAGRDLALAAGADVSVDVVRAARDIALSGEDAFARLIEAGRDVTGSLSGQLLTDQLRAGDDVRLTANSIRATLVLQSTGAGEDSEGDGRNILLVAPGGVSVGTGPTGFLGAPDDVVVRAESGAFQMPTGTLASAGRDLVIEVRTATMGFAEAGRDLSLDLAAGGGGAGGFVSRRRFAAGRDIRIVSGADLILDALDAVGSLTVTVAGPLGAGPATAGLDLDIRANGIGPASFAPFSAQAGRDARIVSTGGVDGGGPLVAGRDATVSANGTVRFTIMEAGDDLEVAAGSGDIISGATRATGLGPDSEGDGSNIRVSGRSAALGPVTAASDLVAVLTGTFGAQSLVTGGDALVTAQGMTIDLAPTIGRDLVITASGGLFQALQPLAAGRDVIVSGAGEIRLGAVTAGRTIGLAGMGGLETGLLTAPDALTALAARMTIAGADVGGDATLETTSGDMLLPGTIAAGGSVRLTAPDTPEGIIRIGRIEAGGGVEATAFSILSAPGGGFVTAGASVRMVGRGEQTIDLEEVVSDDDVDLESPVIRVGLVRSTGLGPDRDGDGFNIRLTGGLGTFGTLEAPTDIIARFTDLLGVETSSAGRDLVLAAGAGTLTLGTAEAGGVATLVGGGLQLEGRLAAAELRLVASGPMRFGGAAGGPGFVVSGADLARVAAPGGISASSGAVPLATTPQGPASAAFEAQFGVGGSSDLVVDSFGFDPAEIARFGFFAGAAASIRVIGDITPSEPGGRITLGANPVDGLTPGAVLISGSLGAGELFLQDCYVALFPLENIAITALGDVIFGNAAFQSAVAAADPSAIDVQAGAPGLPPSPADDRLWAVTETLSITAPGRIVSQNTSSVPGSYAGLVIANRQSGPLVPTVLTVTGGSVVDLSGVLVNGDGRAFFGPTAARSGAILASNPGARFNSCAVSGADSCLPPLADPGLGFRPDQFLPPDPIPPQPFRLTGEILFVLGDTAGVSVLVEDGALFIRRDEEEERPERAPAGR